jgi:DNA polymerase-3 subunit chi
VEIGFDKLGPNKNRHLLINLADQAPQFAVNFGQIIDFVANDAAMKATARDRYRQYRQLGIPLTTQQPIN